MIKQIAGNGRHVTPMIAGIKAFARPLRSLFMELGFERREVKLPERTTDALDRPLPSVSGLLSPDLLIAGISTITSIDPFGTH
ncbi:MAG: hypothetical protein MRJ92_00800 [Nitrospira sp.]|nr:hypothetical protein [Nitrospira sp.]